MSLRPAAALLAGCVALGACAAADPHVRSRGAQQIVPAEPSTPTVPFETVPPPTTSTDTASPTTGADATATTQPDAGGPEFTFPADKVPQSYDAFLEAAINDLQNFWRNEFPAAYGEPYTELQGGIWPMQPGDTLDFGCGTPTTTYADVENNAFYCSEGDFIAYDDASLLPFLNDELGEFSLAVVLSHEWGHAIQFRAGWDTDEAIYLEQQADCFAGAWTAHVARGESSEITFADTDLKNALSAMIFVRDEPGTTAAFDPLAHGSAFDRVGAYEDGFRNGVGQCATYPDDPPTILQFGYGPGEVSDNAPLDDPTGEGNDIFTLIETALNTYWPEHIPGIPQPTIDFFDGDPAAVCSPVPDAVYPGISFFCPADDEVWVERTNIDDIYNRPELGDFGVAYVVATAWAEAGMDTLGVRLEEEQRALAADCMVGAFTRSALPQEFNGIPEQDANGNFRARLSPGDLDEAVSTAILAGDDTEDTDDNGTPFEKIESFRAGVLGDFDACRSRFGL